MDMLTHLTGKRGHLRQEREVAQAALERLDSELTEIEIAIRVIERVIADATHSEGPSRETVARQALRQASENITLRGVIGRVLEDAYPEGLSVHDVVGRAAEIMGQDVSQNTASVTLGRIKNDGHARLDGRHWFHVPRDVETAGSPTTETPAAFNIEQKEPAMDPPS